MQKLVPKMRENFETAVLMIGTALNDADSSSATKLLGNLSKITGIRPKFLKSIVRGNGIPKGVTKFSLICAIESMGIIVAEADRFEPVFRYGMEFLGLHIFTVEGLCEALEYKKVSNMTGVIERGTELSEERRAKLGELWTQRVSLVNQRKQEWQKALAPLAKLVDQALRGSFASSVHPNGFLRSSHSPNDSSLGFVEVSELFEGIKRLQSIDPSARIFEEHGSAIAQMLGSNLQSAIENLQKIQAVLLHENGETS